VTAPTPTLRIELSRREREIAELVGDGFSYKEIGARVRPRIEAATVRVYVNRAARKIDLEGDRALDARLQVFAYIWYERWSRKIDG
jgi:DNA-binding NarL/FixJ family response regulator